jgi:hypothetical protein
MLYKIIYSTADDNYFKPNLITNNFQDIIDYINKKEKKCSDYDESITVNVAHCVKCHAPHRGLNVVNISDLTKRLSNSRTYKNTFTHVKKLHEITFPTLLGQIIDESMIKINELKRFQSVMRKSYSDQNLINLIIPSRDKTIKIPYELLCLFYLHLYTVESGFYRDMNFTLTYEEGFDIYRPFIYLLYNAIHKKVVHSYGTKKLYRGGKLTKKEFDEIELLFKKKKACKNTEINELLYHSNNFLSFSKKENIADSFISTGNYNEIPVKFIINEVNDKDFFISNIDISQFSRFTHEEEVLILPYSCFIIENISKQIINHISVKIINLKMLDSYKSKVNNYIKTASQEELKVFCEKSLKSDFGKILEKNLGKNLGKEIKKNLQKEIKIIKEPPKEPETPGGPEEPEPPRTEEGLRPACFNRAT